MKSKIIVHGGAWDIPAKYHEVHIKGVSAASKRGAELLNSGVNAIDACIEAVKILENDPTFDAGKGAFLNHKGEVELDAIIMDGTDLSIGSVACVQNIQNPIELANLIRLQSDHCMLVGQGAQEFAQSNGIPLVKTEELLVGRELERYNTLVKQGTVQARSFFDFPQEKPSKMGTVGAVAIDQKGRIACATSTGGTPNKLAGRVGDSPLPGAGAYANEFGGISCTGYGESIMKVLLAKSVLDYVEMGLDLTAASKKSIQRLEEKANGLAGVICIDLNGKVHYEYNTPFMARAIADESGLIHAAV